MEEEKSGKTRSSCEFAEEEMGDFIASDAEEPPVSPCYSNWSCIEDANHSRSSTDEGLTMHPIGELIGKLLYTVLTGIGTNVLKTCLKKIQFDKDIDKDII